MPSVEQKAHNATMQLSISNQQQHCSYLVPF